MSKAPSIGSSLSVNIQPRRWYIAWLWVKTFVKYIRIGILLVLCLSIFSSCAKTNIDQGYIVEKEYNPSHTETYYNVALKMPTTRYVSEKYTIWIASKDGVVSKEIEKEVYDSVLLGQFISFDNP